ncbi:MarR family EPS-associated transcriptional regulator [Leptospira wolbachii]
MSHPPMKDNYQYNDHHLKLLQLLQENPHLSQRDASDVMGLSLGKVNYILKAFLDKGLIKMNNFRNNKNKLSYTYLLTPRGIEEKARMTLHFYEVKKREYEALRAEVEKLGDSLESLEA